jgi:hypothetical protein
MKSQEQALHFVSKKLGLLEDIANGNIPSSLTDTQAIIMVCYEVFHIVLDSQELTPDGYGLITGLNTLHQIATGKMHCSLDLLKEEIRRCASFRDKKLTK